MVDSFFSWSAKQQTWKMRFQIDHKFRPVWNLLLPTWIFSILNDIKVKIAIFGSRYLDGNINRHFLEVTGLKINMKLISDEKNKAKQHISFSQRIKVAISFYVNIFQKGNYQVIAPASPDLGHPPLMGSTPSNVSIVWVQKWSDLKR